MDATFWSAVSAIGSVLALLFVAVASWIALRQFKELVRTRHLDGILRVYDLIGSQDARAARRFVFTQLQSAPGQLTDSERENVEYIAVTMDRVGFLTINGLIPEKELLESHCEVFFRTWDKVGPHITWREQATGDRYAPHYRALAERARKYYEQNIAPRASRAS